MDIVRSLKYTTIVLVAFMFAYISTNAQSSVWEPRDIGHGGTTQYVIQYKDSLYCNTMFEGNLYSSNLNGDKWNKVRLKGAESHYIRYIASDEQYIYAALYDLDDCGLYRTDITSNKWEKLYDLTKPNGTIDSVKKIETSNSTLYFSTLSKLYNSTNFGDTWEEINFPQLNGNIVGFTIIENSIYIASQFQFVSSNDLGKSWNEVIKYTSKQTMKIFKINNTLYINQYDLLDKKYSTSIYDKTKNEFESKVPSEFSGFKINAISERGNEAVILQSLDNGQIDSREQILYSEDSGKNWSIIYDTTTVPNSAFVLGDFTHFSKLDICLVQNNILVPLYFKGIFKFDINTNMGSYVEDDFTDVRILYLFNDNNKFSLASNDNGLYFSDEYTKNWISRINFTIYTTGYYPTVLKVIKHKNLLFALANTFILKSSDDGENWQFVINASNIDIISDGGILYTSSDSRLYYSIDDGNSWIVKNTLDNFIIYSLLIDGDILYAYSDKGIYSTNDKGETWTKLSNINPVQGSFLNRIKKVRNSLVVTDGVSIYTSTDKGINWNKMPNSPKIILNQQFYNTYYQYIHPHDNLLFLATASGLFLSLDYAKTWDKLDSTVFPKGLSCLTTYKDSVYVVPIGDVIYKANIADLSKIKITNVPRAFCNGETYELPFTVKKDIQFDANNKFIAQLSDENGVFDDNVTDIGSINTQTDGTIIITIPEGISYSSQYRIRVVATEPYTLGIDNLHNITIVASNPINITGDNEVCSDKEYIYSVNTASGYTYHWEIEGGTILNDPNKTSIRVSWDNVNIGTLKIVQKSDAGCSDSTELSVNIIETAPKPIITQLDNNTLVSSNEYGNQWYFNGNKLANDTNKVLSVNKEGNYAVQTTNSFGCESELSDTFQYINEGTTLHFTIDTSSVNTGENVSINLRLIKDKQYYNLKPSKFEGTLKFNATILYPNNVNKGIVSNGERFITFAFDTNYITSNIVHISNLKAMLGEVDKTEITLTNLIIDGKPYTDFNCEKGLFTLSDVCYEGGARLVTSNQNNGIVNVSPNPTSDNIDIEFHIDLEGIVDLYIQDQLGNRLIDIANENLKFGDYNYKVNTNSLAIGKYNVVLKTNNYLSTYSIMIIR